MNLPIAVGYRQKLGRAPAPRLRWVNGEPFVLPGRPNRRRFAPHLPRGKWPIGLAAALGGLVLGYWTLGAGSAGQHDVHMPSVDRQPQSAIEWISVGAAPAASQSGASVVASATPSAPAAVWVPPALSNPDRLTTVAPDEVAATLSEAALSDMLKARFEGRAVEGTPRGVVTIQDLRVRLLKPDIVTEGNVKVGLLTLPVSFSATVAVQDGRSLITIQTAKLATTVAPEEIRARLERVVQRFADEMLLAEQVRLTSLAVSNGELSATGVRIQGDGLP